MCVNRLPRSVHPGAMVVTVSGELSGETMSQRVGRLEPVLAADGPQEPARQVLLEFVVGEDCAVVT
jgi:hypothetical protein